MELASLPVGAVMARAVLAAANQPEPGKAALYQNLTRVLYFLEEAEVEEVGVALHQVPELEGIVMEGVVDTHLAQLRPVWDRAAVEVEAQERVACPTRAEMVIAVRSIYVGGINHVAYFN